jgi:hypothetical protein
MNAQDSKGDGKYDKGAIPGEAGALGLQSDFVLEWWDIVLPGAGHEA